MIARLFEFLNKRFLFFLLLLAGLNGLFYIFMVPPWEHYDEPTHFEYAWLIAHLERIPEEDDSVQWMRREVAASMYETGFFEDRGFFPNLLEVEKPVWLGISQLNDPPLYYLIISLPLRLVQYSDVVLQLIVARLTSFLLFLGTLLFVYRTCQTLFSPGHVLSKMVPVFIAFLPSFVDSMTSVNNDVGAVFFSTIFFWAAVCYLKQEKKFGVVAVMVIAGTGVMFSKNIGYIFIFLFVLVLLLGIQHRWVLAGLAAGFVLVAILSVVALIDFGAAPAYFYSQNYQKMDYRVQSDKAVTENYVFLLERIAQQSPRSNLVYYFNDQTAAQITTDIITVGGYVWADTNLKTNVLDLYINDQLASQINLEVDEEPAFFSESAYVQEKITSGRIALSPDSKENTEIFYDDLFLVSGTAEEFITGEKPNLLRNPSAETGWPQFDPRFAKFVNNHLPVNIDDFWGILDWKSHKDYYVSSANRLFRSFWAVFDWGGVFLLGNKPYRLLGVITLFGLSGAVFDAVLRRKKMPWNIASLLLVSALLIWGGTFMRGFGTSLDSYTYVPLARYTYPAILPTAVILVTGLYFWLSILRKKVKITDPVLWTTLLFGMIGLNIWALASIVVFYTA